MGFFGSKVKVPELPKVDLSQEQKSAIAENQGALPDANRLASSVNAFNSAELQKLMAQAFPFFNQMLGKASSSTADLLAGNVPSDVSSAVGRSAAARALAGGYGGTGAANALTARDLGRTTLDLQQQGLSNFGALTQISQAVMPKPFDVTSMFMTPLQRATWTNEQNLQQFQRNTAQAQQDAAASPFGSFLGGLLGTAAKTGIGLGGFALGRKMFKGTPPTPTSDQLLWGLVNE